MTMTMLTTMMAMVMVMVTVSILILPPVGIIVLVVLLVCRVQVRSFFSCPTCMHCSACASELAARRVVAEARESRRCRFSARASPCGLGLQDTLRFAWQLSLSSRCLLTKQKTYFTGKAWDTDFTASAVSKSPCASYPSILNASQIVRLGLSFLSSVAWSHEVAAELYIARKSAFFGARIRAFGSRSSACPAVVILVFWCCSGWEGEALGGPVSREGVPNLRENASEGMQGFRYRHNRHDLEY